MPPAPPRSIREAETRAPLEPTTANPPRAPTWSAFAIARSINARASARGRSRACTWSAPDLFRGLDDQRQLRQLILTRELVALRGRGEAALRREAELLDVDVLRGRLDPALELVL